CAPECRSFCPDQKCLKDCGCI
uniref:Peptide Hact-2 n=1 Tax=Heliofungia actiniformis TaxID=75303 RepID=HACT2_HELAT|nr:RecName: Full=Peptide Hact-2 [Heliofungia actiniformis]7LRW_A Chain A, Hact-2 [Heliofungia actiniformis]